MYVRLSTISRDKHNNPIFKILIFGFFFTKMLSSCLQEILSYFEGSGEDIRYSYFEHLVCVKDYAICIKKETKEGIIILAYWTERKRYSGTERESLSGSRFDRDRWRHGCSTAVSGTPTPCTLTPSPEQEMPTKCDNIFVCLYLSSILSTDSLLTKLRHNLKNCP